MLIPVRNGDFLIFHATAEPHFLPSRLRAVIVRVYPGHSPRLPNMYFVPSQQYPISMNALKGLEGNPAATVPTVRTM